MKIAYLNNKFIPLNKTNISILDRGLLYGDGAFETMHSRNGVVFLLEKHLDRLYRTLKRLDISLKIQPAEIEKVIYSLLERNKLNDAYIKIIVTRGKTEGLLVSARRHKPTFIIYALPQKPLPAHIYKKGIKACFSKDIFNERSKVAGNKTLNYLENTLCRYEAEKRGFDDVIFTNTKGFITEASSSNIFWLKNGILFTPHLKSGCLPGIIRAEVIKLSKKILKVKEVLVKKEILYSSGEIFLTNSIKGIMPAARVGKWRVGKGGPGPVTDKIMEHLKGSIENYCGKNKK